MKHSLFWAAVEAAAKAARSGLSVVGALVDCGIPRQHAGAQWLTEFEEENECLEAPLSADFTDEPCPQSRLSPERFVGSSFCLDCPHAPAHSASATAARVVEEGLTEGAHPPAAPSVSAAINYRGEQLSWAEYVQPAIDAVLTDHIYEFGFLTNCTCGSTGIFDWRDWCDHLGPLLAARIETVTLAINEAQKEQR